MLRQLAFLLAVLVWSVSSAFAQLPDNTSLNGVYNVRYLGVQTDPADTPVSFQGTLTFDGKGGYTVSGSGITSGAALQYRTSGTYQVISSGMLTLDNPFDPVTSNGTFLYGGVAANGAVIASSTDTIYCDLFVAIPAASNASAATLNGNYRVASMEFLNGDTVGGTRNAFFTMSANGSGSLGNVSIQGTAQSLNSVATTQTSSGATYTVTGNGSGTLVLPAPSGVTAANTLLSGSKILYVSNDGSFFVAGSATGYDMEVGVKTGGTTIASGLYWESLLENFQGSSDPTQNGIDSAQGSANEGGAPDFVEILHERYNIDGFFSYDQTSTDTFSFDATGSAVSSSYGYAIGANGSIIIGAGLGSDYLLDVLIKAPTMNAPSGTTVFLNPQGVANSASFAPVTTSVAPGEFVTIFGSGMGPSTAAVASAPFPATLGGVQVMISWSGQTAVAAPLYFVSAGQISFVVPYNAPVDGSFLTLQVVYNGASSNKVNVYSGATSPGVFTNTPFPFTGAIVKNSDGSIVSSSNPVKAGDSIAIFVGGLGAVTPSVTAGAAAPSSPLSQITDTFFEVFIDDVQATVSFAGLAPTFGGLYQVNLVVPAGVTPGAAQSITVETADALSFSATIPISR